MTAELVCDQPEEVERARRLRLLREHPPTDGLSLRTPTGAAVLQRELVGEVNRRRGLRFASAG